MAPLTISIARVVALNVPRAWHEAVPTALACADRIATTRVQASLETCAISAEGEVTVTAAVGSPFRGDPLLCLTTALVDRSSAPEELISLLTRYESQPSLPLAGFARELTFFTRPDAAAAIRALAIRALAMDRDAHMQAECQQLRAAAVAISPQAAVAKGRSSRVRQALLAAGSVGTVVAAGGVVAYWPADTSAKMATAAPVAAVTQSVDHVIERGLRSLGFPMDDRLALDTTAAPPATAPRRTAATLPARLPLPLARAMAPLPPVQEAAVANAEPLRLLLAEGDDDHVAIRGRDGGNTIYNDGDVAVQPPRMTRPQLRVDAKAPPAPRTGYVEVVVNEVGTVDRVRLHATDSSVHERMLISAIKTWQFRPALKEGQPVKYLLRVPLPPEDGR